MPSFYYKAIDAASHKLTGTIYALNAGIAERDLRLSGLRPYFLRDLRNLKSAIRRKKRRHKIIAIVGTLAIASSLVLSGVLVGYAGRERAPDIEAYRNTGILEDTAEPIVTKSDKEHEFAIEILKIWNNFVPGVTSRIEVRSFLMTIYVNKKIRNYDDEEIENLATQTVMALQRRFSASGSTLLLVEGNQTLLEINYSPYTKSTRVKFYN